MNHPDWPKNIQRFPRLKETQAIQRFPRKKLTRIEKLEERVAKGDTPRNYDRLTKKQKKMAKLVASGMSIKDACSKLHVKRATFWGWRRAHPMFKEYLYRICVANLKDVEHRLDHQILRAAQVVDDVFETPDIYLQASMAEKVLKGRGRWKTATQVDSKKKVEFDGTMNVAGSVQTVDKEMMKILVEGLVQIAGGNRTNEQLGSVIDVRPALPESTEGSASEGSPGS